MQDGFEGLLAFVLGIVTADTVKITVFLVMTPWSVVEIY
jgi:uncharacterized membrane protein